MMRIYDVAQSERGTELMKAILDAAYTRNAALSDAAAQKFAEELFVACMQTGGDMDAILGRRL
jgi:hypothetical protein